jgi:predicted aminopeptidase
MPVLYPYQADRILPQRVTAQVRSVLALIALSILLVQLGGCSTGYYWQAATGQLRLVNGREPIDELLDQPDIAPELRARLVLSQVAVKFAHEELLLPDNGSYASYYDSKQPYIVWNVFAAPEFSLEPRSWCFLVAGCVTYRGYFDVGKADKYAAKLAARGNDVYVGGVRAYSTLGRFKDPVLNTMLPMSERAFAGLLFHELAHQRLYVKDDTAFNEGFAGSVEQIGLQRWQVAGHDEGAVPSDSRGVEMREYQRQQVMVLLGQTRTQLESLYAGELPEREIRPAKAAILTVAGDAYLRLVADWRAAGLQERPYETMILRGLNNASLSAVAVYEDYVPAFMRLYRDCTETLSCFYAKAEELAEREPEARSAALERLLASG